MFTQAITRIPAENFAEGITTANLGEPEMDLVYQQHDAYCAALEHCGLEVTRLPAAPAYPDSTFVEDTAVLTDKFAVLSFPGAESRRGEIEDMHSIIQERFERIYRIKGNGRLDGGDILQADTHFYIGISARTNYEGAEQLAGFLKEEGFDSTTVDIRSIQGLLHLKSGISYIGDATMLMIEPLVQLRVFKPYKRIPVPDNESYAANCIRVNQFVLVPYGFAITANRIQHAGFYLLPLNMDEFQKMDGGLSCLSLRY